MGCNCKKKNEQVKQKYYVPATDTEPAQIIEMDTNVSGSTNNTEENLNNDGQIGETQT